MSTKPCIKSYRVLKLTLSFELLSVMSTSFRSYQNLNEPNPKFGFQTLFYPDRDLQPNTERGGICVCCNAFLPSISSKKTNPLSILLNWVVGTHMAYSICVDGVFSNRSFSYIRSYIRPFSISDNIRARKSSKLEQ